MVRPKLKLERRGGRAAMVLTGMESGDGKSREPDWVRVQGDSCRTMLQRGAVRSEARPR